MKPILLKCMMVGVMMTVSATGICRNYYSVSVDTPTNAVSESEWQTEDTAISLAPQTAAQIAAHGMLLPMPSQPLVAGFAWEVDLGVLQPDGNIAHLLGTATVLGMTPSPKNSVASIAAHLTGTQDANCRAALQAHVDVTSQQLLVEKLHFTCLGADVRVATAALPKE